MFLENKVVTKVVTFLGEVVIPINGIGTSRTQRRTLDERGVIPPAGRYVATMPVKPRDF